MTYTSTSSGLQLETARFCDGVIRVTGTTQEVNYFLTDHLGSVRVIADATGAVKERNDYYTFGAKHVRSNYPQNTNRYDFNAKEEQTTGDLKFLDYGARMYDNTIGRWFSPDPAYDSFYSHSPFHFSGGNPVRFVDLDGAMYTHYVDDNYNTLLQTNDGSDDVVIVPQEYHSLLRYYAKHYDWALGYGIEEQWWKDMMMNDFGFHLADRQFSELELFVLDMQTSDWSRNASAAYLLNPTWSNMMKAGLSEVASQWMDPERLAMAASVGIAGSSSYIPRTKFGGVPRPSPNFRTPTNPAQLPRIAPNGLTLRVMKPTSQYPNGYWVWEKPMKQGGYQKFNPSTMKTGTEWETHIPLPPGYWK